MFKKILIFILCALFSPFSAVCADSVERIDSAAVSGSVSSVTDDELVVSGVKCYMSDVAVIRFGRPCFPQAQSYITLVDGSRLSGRIVRREKGFAVFRSPSFGELEVRMRDIANVVYDSVRLSQAAPVPDDAGGASVLLKDMSYLRGRVYYLDSGVAAFAPDGGSMKRYSAQSEIYAVFWRGFSPERRIVLRNGDVLNGKARFDGTFFSASFSSSELKRIPLSALKEICLLKKSNEIK